MDILDEQDLYEPSTDAPTKKKDLVELLQRRRKHNDVAKAFLTQQPQPLAPLPSKEFDPTFLLIALASGLAVYGGYSLGKDVFYLGQKLFSKELVE